MTTLNEKLAKVMAITDETEQLKCLHEFCRSHFEDLPLPGESKLFDQAMWNACQFGTLSKGDEAIVKRVTDRMIASTVTVGEKAANLVSAAAGATDKAVFMLKDLVGQARETAVATWQDMLAANSWQQMVPAGATRGVGAQLVSLGTFERQVDHVRVQMNLGWLVDDNNLRLLLQAKDEEDNAISDVEVRIMETERGMVFSRKTNEDGAMVAPSVKVGPGQYQIQVFFTDKVVETPFFRI
ncbi:MAG: hypothetical protein JSS83_01270 [Cyanobacteria bacterium SZAS LIN-3]|nr:hypothetical protein [Cyanobacteria bacterium SZAS LIN-3]MBS2005633.1 hypothetical protein [Cyanobacteria bacterium SZAS TMP-1]